LRIKGKMKVLALCVILIIPNLLISIALGEVDIKKAIIGKWGQYDQKLGGMEYFEFFEDGTVFTFHDGLKMSAGGDYKFIDKNRIRINLAGIWSLVGPVVCKVSVSGDTLILTLPDGKVEEYKKAHVEIPKTVSPSEDKKQTEQQIAGYQAEINNINTLLQGVGGALLECPKQNCNDYEEEAAKVLISHLVSKKTGKWITDFIKWQIVKKLIVSGLDEAVQIIISAGIEVGVEKIKEIIKEIKNKFEKSNGADGKVVDLKWKNIGALPIYFPYKNRDGRYGRVDGEALIVFYSPHSVSLKDLKKEVNKGGGHLAMYAPPIGLREKLRLLPDEGIIRPFTIIIRGTVYEMGEVKTYETWGGRIQGPRVTFYGEKQDISPRLQITSSLRIIDPPPYELGQSLTAEFTLKNNGSNTINLDVLTVGGRVNDICPNDKCPDFDWKTNVTLRPDEVYHYKGKLKLESPGNYHFFTTYRTKDGQWNTSIPTAQGVKNTVDIKVVESYPTSKDGAKITDIVNFEIPINKIFYEFTYTQGGILIYQGRKFNPSVIANINDVRKFKVSILRPKGLAAAIAVDNDGKHKLFFIDLNKGTSILVPGCAALDVFWSPSQKYLVTLCSYEGQWFVSIDLYTQKIRKGVFLGPSNKIWLIKDKPHWIGTSDVLSFVVDEFCNYYENPNCGRNMILATYVVHLDAVSFKIQSQRLFKRTGEKPESEIGKDVVKNQKETVACGLLFNYGDKEIKNLIPLVMFSGGKYYSAWALLRSDNPLKQKILNTKRYWLYHKGIRIGTFSITGPLGKLENGMPSFTGNVNWESKPSGDLATIAENTIALSQQILQPFYPKNLLLNDDQKSGLDNIIRETLIRPKEWYNKLGVNYDQHLEGKTPKSSGINTFILKPGGSSAVYRNVRWGGTPCGEMYASVFALWSGRWSILRRSTYLAECPGRESIGDDHFVVNLVGDIDGDSVAELIINEGRWESWQKGLYKVLNGKLTKVLDIGNYGS